MPTPYSFSTQDGVLILKIGNLLGERANQQVLRATEARMEQGHDRLVVDLSQVDYMNSVGLNLLIILHKKLNGPTRGLVVAGASGKVRELLVMTKLLDLFELRPTLPEAVAALQP